MVEFSGWKLFMLLQIVFRLLFFVDSEVGGCGCVIELNNFSFKWSFYDATRKNDLIKIFNDIGGKRTKACQIVDAAELNRT